MNSDVHPVFALRSYAWAVIKANTTLTEAQYNNIVPITPLSEEPELTDINLPLISYGYDEQATNDVYVEREGSMTFVVYDANFRRLTQILNILAAAFGRWDDAAKDVNHYLRNIPSMKDLRFGELHMSLLDGGTPEETEGGRQSGMIAISFTYYVDYNVITRL